METSADKLMQLFIIDDTAIGSLSSSAVDKKELRHVVNTRSKSPTFSNKISEGGIQSKNVGGKHVFKI